jgi:hypothetical protein
MSGLPSVEATYAAHDDRGMRWCAVAILERKIRVCKSAHDPRDLRDRVFRTTTCGDFCSPKSRIVWEKKTHRGSQGPSDFNGLRAPCRARILHTLVFSLNHSFSVRRRPGVKKGELCNA